MARPAFAAALLAACLAVACAPDPAAGLVEWGRASRGGAELVLRGPAVLKAGEWATLALECRGGLPPLRPRLAGADLARQFRVAELGAGSRPGLWLWRALPLDPGPLALDDLAVAWPGYSLALPAWRASVASHFAPGASPEPAPLAPDPAESGVTWWPIVLLGLLAAGAAAWLMRRRRRAPAEPPFNAAAAWSALLAAWAADPERFVDSGALMARQHGPDWEAAPQWAGFAAALRRHKFQSDKLSLDEQRAWLERLSGGEDAP